MVPNSPELSGQHVLWLPRHVLQLFCEATEDLQREQVAGLRCSRGDEADPSIRCELRLVIPGGAPGGPTHAAPVGKPEV